MNLEEVTESVKRLRQRREEMTKLKDYRPQTKGKGGSGAATPDITGLLGRLMAKQTPVDAEAATEGGDISGTERPDCGPEAGEGSEGAQKPA